MKRFLLPVIAALLLFTANVSVAQTIPLVIKVQPNYGRGGSCVHACTATSLGLHGWPLEAAQWLRQHSGGCSLERLAEDLRRAGYSVVATFNGDQTLLDIAPGTGIIIEWRGRRGNHHAVLFLGYGISKWGTIAVISDSNRPGRFVAYAKGDFLAFWHQCGGKAVRWESGHTLIGRDAT